MAPYRAYNAALGTLECWISRDPLGESGGIDLYGYVGNDPVNNLDPTGLLFESPEAAIGLIIITAALAGPEIANAPGPCDKTYPSQGISPLVAGIGIAGAGNWLIGDLLAPVAGKIFGGLMGRSVAETGTIESILLPGGKVIGSAGSQTTIREISGGLSDAQSLFHKLSSGGETVSAGTYPGTLVRLPHGGTVGIRTTMSKSPGTAATIDVNISGIPITKIKFNP